MYNKDSVEWRREIDFGKRNKGQICAYLKANFGVETRLNPRNVFHVYFRKMTAKLKTQHKKNWLELFYDDKCLKKYCITKSDAFLVDIREKHINDISKLFTSWYMKILYKGLR